MPAIAPSLLTLLEKIPIISAGKIEEAARPKARATVPGGKSRRIEPEVARHQNGNRHGDPAGHQFLLLGDVRA